MLLFILLSHILHITLFITKRVQLSRPSHYNAAKTFELCGVRGPRRQQANDCPLVVVLFPDVK